MRLASFGARNYRSITTTHKLPLSDPTVLIGPNNEGKSNILQALVCALQLASGLDELAVFGGKVHLTQRRREEYQWQRDFPVALQTTTPKGQSVFTLEFELTEAEIDDFRREVGSTLNGRLTIELSVSREDVFFRVVKRGPGAAVLTKKAKPIGKFIARRIDIVYVPAVRTAKAAQQVVEEMVERELARVERDAEYRNAVAEIERIQAPVLRDISERIQSTLAEFLPAVKRVSVDISRGSRFRALRRSCEITVDDGTATLLDHKGDGMQSLAALSLMRRSGDTRKPGKSLILALEEPESHLHPLAIHQLRKVLRELASQHQVIMTSHCPLFVERARLESNIVVAQSRAAPARSIAEVRRVLGVRPADNLQAAELVLLVEGEDDRLSVTSLLAQSSARLAAALADGALAIDSLLGATNLAYKCGETRRQLCEVHAFLDDDEAGRLALKRALGEGVLEEPEYTLGTCVGMRNAEFEDLLDDECYRAAVEARYGITLDSPKFRTADKWSDRMKGVFRQQGKIWDAGVERQVKFLVADAVCTHPERALNSVKRQAFDSLIRVLENRLA